MTPTHWRRGLIAAAALCLSTVGLHAALPTFWQVSTEADFLKGEVDNLAIDTYGRLTLGPTTTSVFDSNAPFLWTMVEGSDGSVFVGSGNEGQVHRIDPTGRSSVFFDAEELEVHALAAAPNGGLYAATSPDGQIYRIEAPGRATPFFDPPDKYIWSLAVDRAGNVFAATGDKGVVYRITPEGKGSRFYETKATHAMSLAFDRDGRLLVGSESPGRLFRVDAPGKAFVLLDSSYNEIHALRVAPNGTIYAAALNARSAAGATPPPAAPETAPAPTLTPTVTTEVTNFVIAADSVTVSPGGASQPTPARAAGMSAGAVYRIDTEGASDVIWESREDSPYDLTIDGDGSLTVTTGSKGKIYRLAGDPTQPTLIARINVQQITSMLRDRSGRLLFATANPGKVLSLSSVRADHGIYTSEVRDATTVATWGAIKWQAQARGGAKVEISTRSGNTRTPDDTWSDWSAPYTDANGSAVVSPRARYLQWRASISAARSGDAPLLTSVTAAYLPRNLRPKVTSITIHPPGTVFQRPFPTGDPEIAGFEGDTPDRRFAAQSGGANAPGTPNLGRRAYQRGLLTFVWRGEDDNRDELAYDVLYRREGETAWKALKKALPDQILVWDTTSVPNGRYMLRVVASDAASNSPATALTGSMDSTTFDVDNTPPAIVVTAARREGARAVISFDVRDLDSSVLKVEYSLDGDRWQAIYPKDGIADSRAESFDLTLEGEMASRGVIIRAADALNNIASIRGEAPPASGRR